MRVSGRPSLGRMVERSSALHNVNVMYADHTLTAIATAIRAKEASEAHHIGHKILKVVLIVVVIVLRHLSIPIGWYTVTWAAHIAKVQVHCPRCCASKMLSTLRCSSRCMEALWPTGTWTLCRQQLMHLLLLLLQW